MGCENKFARIRRLSTWFERGGLRRLKTISTQHDSLFTFRTINNWVEQIVG